MPHIQQRTDITRQAPLPSGGENALWSLDIGEVTGKNIEVAGREDVNRLLSEGWLLLHMYTLIYREDGVWRERPMAILGLPRNRMNTKD
jgi:hypothetical protein